MFAKCTSMVIVECNDNCVENVGSERKCNIFLMGFVLRACGLEVASLYVSASPQPEMCSF